MPWAKSKTKCRHRSRQSPPRGNPAAASRTHSCMFFLNLGQTELYKPMQGWYARLYTALGLGVIAAAGVWQCLRIVDRLHSALAVGHPRGLALGFGWLIFRIVHFPPFAEFLIATEAEMNKVSWTSKEDLYPRDHGGARPRSCSWRCSCSWSIGSGLFILRNDRRPPVQRRRRLRLDRLIGIDSLPAHQLPRAITERLAARLRSRFILEQTMSDPIDDPIETTPEPSEPETGVRNLVPTPAQSLRASR